MNSFLIPKYTLTPHPEGEIFMFLDNAVYSVISVRFFCYEALGVKTEKISAFVICILILFGGELRVVEASDQRAGVYASSSVFRDQSVVEKKVSEEIIAPGEGVIEYAPPGEERRPIKLQKSISDNVVPPGKEGIVRNPRSGVTATTPKVRLPETLSELRSIAMYALSRGKGVPEGSREALRKFRRLLREAEKSGEIVQLTEQRIGLEGETKICAEFVSPDFAEKAWLTIQKMVGDQDLLNIRAERCQKN